MGSRLNVPLRHAFYSSVDVEETVWPVLSLLATVSERRRAAEQGIKLLEKGVGPNKHQAAATGQLLSGRCHRSAGWLPRCLHTGDPSTRLQLSLIAGRACRDAWQNKPQLVCFSMQN